MKRFLLSAAAVFVLSNAAHAADLIIREVHVTAISHPDTGELTPLTPRIGRAATDADTAPVTIATPAEHALMPRLQVYPVAGTVGRDLFIPYYVDMDGGDNLRDFNCTKATFGGHTGHDPYIRSFREQAIGVPVFAPLDGYVTEVHDGEPDENINADTGGVSNYVTLDHGSNIRTRYQHLKKSSITVKAGDRITAGTQFALVGSSGASAAPHVHFDITRDGHIIEPMAGPCRPGQTLFVNPPATTFQPTAIGAAISNQSFGVYRPAPYDDTPRTGTFTTGQRTVYLKVNIAGLPKTWQYVVSAVSPSGQVIAAKSGQTTLIPDYAYLASAWWALDVPFDREGRWTITLDVDGKRVADLPVTVVSNSSQASNRAPQPLSASLEPVGQKAGEVPQCRAGAQLVSDLDYDILSYRYEWKVDGNTVRNVTTAATSDALPRDAVRAGSSVSCSVTASDGRLESATSTAFATTAGGGRRSIVRH